MSGRARYLAKHDYDGLRTATRRLVRAVGKLGAGAEITRVGPSTLAAYYEPAPTKTHELTWMPVDVAADLEEACGQPHVTRALAAVSGHLLLRVRGDRSSPLARDFARIAREAAELFARYEQALADDGRVTPREAGAIVAETDELLAALMTARADLLAKAEEGA